MFASAAFFRLPNLRIHRLALRSPRGRRREDASRRSSGRHGAAPRRRWHGDATTLFVLLKAFASGSAALTGVESISNGVTAFRHPQARNAGKTLLVMAGIAITLFVGVSYLAVEMHAHPSSTDSILSQVARGVFCPAGSTGSTIYYLVQAFTLAILVLAANTSYQGFPRLGALLARDGFFPRQFSNLGTRSSTGTESSSSPALLPRSSSPSGPTSTGSSTCT